MAALAAGPPGTFSSVGEIVASVEDAGGARVLMIRGRARQRIFRTTGGWRLIQGTRDGKCVDGRFERFYDKVRETT